MAQAEPQLGMAIKPIVAASTGDTRSRHLPLLIFMSAALVAVIPFFFYGNPSGHDFEFHLNTWLEVVNQWHHGIIYPRWAALSQFGYGDPHFIFYPPVSWLLGGALGAILPWKIVPGVFVWIALTLSGLSMFALTRNWMSANRAIATAALYAVNPYFIVIVYLRSAFAELLAGALLPLLLLQCIRVVDSGNKNIAPLALLVAAVWVTNVPAAIMMMYSLAFILSLIALTRRSVKPLLIAAAAVALSFALIAFYIVPVIYERSWITVSQAISPGVRPIDNFLFTRTGDPDHDRFNLLISLLASLEAIVLCICAWNWWQNRDKSTLLARIIFPWGLSSAVVLLPFTSFLWNHVPELQFVQFPWRWLLCLTVALFLAIASRRRPMQAFIYMALWGVLAVELIRVQPPWWDSASDIHEMVENQTFGIGYEGVDEYVPAGGDAYEIKADAPKVTATTTDEQIIVENWQPEFKQFSLNANAATTLTLHLFNYPAWKADVNGTPISTESDPRTGQMLLSVPAGTSHIQLKFTRTPDRVAGAIISALTFTFIILTRLRRRSTYP